MFGHFRLSHMSGGAKRSKAEQAPLWFSDVMECSTAERSEAGTALNARTRVRVQKIWQPALPKPERSALHTPYGHSS